MPKLLPKSLIGLCLLLSLALNTTAQKQKTIPNYPDRYRLDIPKEWRKPKLISAITDILPKTIDELKDRDFCTNGKALYCVHLTIDSLRIENQQSTLPTESGQHSSHTFSFSYRFYAALTVFDSLERLVARLQSVSPEEVFDYSKQYSGMNAQNVTYTREAVRDTSGNVIGSQVVQDAPAFNTIEPKHNAWSVLTEDFLMDICEQKIYGIKKLLK